ncbi:MAG: phage portal protein family protein [Flavobacteriales bacterium]
MAKKKKSSSKKNGFQAVNQIEPKALSQTRADVKTWKNAIAMATNVDNPKMFPLYNLFKDIEIDALLSSQIENRKNKVLGSPFSIKNANGDIDEEATKTLTDSVWFPSIVSNILDSRYNGYTLIELDFKPDGKPFVELVPRQNVLPYSKEILKDSTEDKGENYGNAPEFNTWLLDFGKPGDFGLLNKLVPHVLFKRFASSCWSELCEIYGIPPRVMKTDTQNKAALNRAEAMMKDWGAAAWFIIDESEKIEWAQGMSTSGEVYSNLIAHCNNEISMLISGAIIGQDTKNGSKGKELSSQDVLQDLVNADKVKVQEYSNDKVLDALYRIGLIPSEGMRLEYDLSEDLTELWTRTKDVLAYKDVDNDWIEDKFGIPVKDKAKEPEGQKLNLSSFFD